MAAPLHPLLYNRLPEPTHGGEEWASIWLASVHAVPGCLALSYLATKPPAGWMHNSA